MRILHAVEFYPPSVGAAEEVIRQIYKRVIISISGIIALYEMRYA